MLRSMYIYTRNCAHLEKKVKNNRKFGGARGPQTRNLQKAPLPRNIRNYPNTPRCLEGTTAPPKTPRMIAKYFSPHPLSKHDNTGLAWPFFFSVYSFVLCWKQCPHMPVLWCPASAVDPYYYRTILWDRKKTDTVYSASVFFFLFFFWTKQECMLTENKQKFGWPLSFFSRGEITR